jgi:DNA-binding LytR/AlgR family response regulator
MFGDDPLNDELSELGDRKGTRREAGCTNACHLHNATASASMKQFENALDCTGPILLKQTGPSSKLMDTSLPTQAFAATRSSRIAIKARGKIVFMDSAEIIALEADGNSVSLRHTSGRYVIRESISSVAEKLNPFGFVRIHRCVLVNRVYIEELRRCDTGVYLLRVSGGKEYTITRTFKENLKFLAASWLGTEI